MRLQRWRSFPLQLFVLTVLPLTFLLLAIAFGSLTLHQRAMRSMVGERDERATRAAAAAVTEQLNHRRAAIRSLAMLAAAADSPADGLAEAAFIQPDFEGGTALLTAAGTMLATSNGRERWDRWATSERLLSLQAPATDGAAQFSDPFIDPLTGEEIMFAVATSGELTAVGAFAPATLARRALVDLFSGTEQATAFVVTGEGQLIYQIGSLSLGDGDLRHYPGVAEALRGESGTSYRSAGSDERVIAFSPIPPVGWALVIVEPWRAMVDPLLRATELAPLILIPVLVIALAALWLGVRQIVQPLQLLEKKATELGWGDFAAIEEPVGGINEIQRLQTELIHMAQKVKVAQQSLRGYLGAVTAGQEEERRRLARDLHDDTIQSLIALNQQIQLAQLSEPDEAHATRLRQMGRMVEQVVADLRRLTHDLRPIYLEDLGLVPALEMLARDTAKTLAIPVTFELSGEERRLQPEVELAFYRIAQEGLSNVARHATATEACVRLSFAVDRAKLMVTDNGRGFVVPESPAEMAPAGHFGLLGVQERAETIGARLNLTSTPGEGTQLTVSLRT